MAAPAPAAPATAPAPKLKLGVTAVAPKLNPPFWGVCWTLCPNIPPPPKPGGFDSVLAPKLNKLLGGFCAASVDALLAAKFITGTFVNVNGPVGAIAAVVFAVDGLKLNSGNLPPFGVSVFGVDAKLNGFTSVLLLFVVIEEFDLNVNEALKPVWF